MPTVNELRKQAREAQISGYSRMSKDELIKALAEEETGHKPAPEIDHTLTPEVDVIPEGVTPEVDVVPEGVTPEVRPVPDPVTPEARPVPDPVTPGVDPIPEGVTPEVRPVPDPVTPEVTAPEGLTPGVDLADPAERPEHEIEKLESRGVMIGIPLHTQNPRD